MRILVVSNLYPPYYHGGYEVRCMQVAETLQHTGHDVSVLTSTYGLPVSRSGHIQPLTELMNGVPVHRWLHQYAYGSESSFHRPRTIFRAKREISDTRKFIRLLRDFEPDIVNWWSMNGLAKPLLSLPGQWAIPDVHWIEHPWMINEYGPSGEKAATFWINLWEGDWGPLFCRPLLRRIGRWWEKRIEQEGLPTRRFYNSPSHVCFVSEYLMTLYEKGGIEFPFSEIIHGGVPTAPFYRPIRALDVSRPLRLLYASQITPDRGLHTVVEALIRIDEGLRSQLSLSIAGHVCAYYGYYLEEVKQRVKELGLSGSVSYLGKIPLAQMPELYERHDVLIFPSSRPEGLPLTMVEAMLAGCAVVTTGSGGAMEIAQLADLPLFPADDPDALSRVLVKLLLNRPEVLRIASHGQKVALQKFTSDRMMDRWTETLQKISRTYGKID
jgi:glycogen synthase